ncbi:MAG: hypothetical protein IPO77_02775 [Acidobacteria bacterium]|nr:hypothetical protein [Acidobacteriota bacterium]
MKEPLIHSRFALVTTAGFRFAGAGRFRSFDQERRSVVREIPNTVDVATLIESHRSSSFDHSGVEADQNIAFPLDRFRELEQQGIIGALNHRQFSF